MSLGKHRIHPAARAELRRAAQRYRSEGAEEHGHEFGWRLASRFRDEFKRSLASVLENPERWPAYLHGTRRILLRSFPFAIVYLVAADGDVFVVALAHHSRAPGYWDSRPT